MESTGQKSIVASETKPQSDFDSEIESNSYSYSSDDASEVCTICSDDMNDIEIVNLSDVIEGTSLGFQNNIPSNELGNQPNHSQAEASKWFNELSLQSLDRFKIRIDDLLKYPRHGNFPAPFDQPSDGTQIYSSSAEGLPFLGSSMELESPPTLPLTDISDIEVSLEDGKFLIRRKQN